MNAGRSSDVKGLKLSCLAYHLPESSLANSEPTSGTGACLYYIYCLSWGNKPKRVKLEDLEKLFWKYNFKILLSLC